ncbi:UvrD-helicase domain-containing protein [uncultured Methanobrevibacter sp.]|uniref:UvrD-helicase domain-containing protein n=1 Tax=uncultured Methanobrevibacter sp. TaxID=253161 RepID=UPI0025D38682|nr:UvrD-helicase domain-containing protein [uncultured Methanobrevibacter sp.]
MDFCPNCGSIIFRKGTILKCSCGYYRDLNKFDINNLEINPGSKFIWKDYKTYLKNNYDEFLKLIKNKNEIKFTKEELMGVFNQIINKANEKFIEKEKKIVLSEFKRDLNSNDKCIEENERENYRKKFNKDYCPYYDYLEMDNIIDKFNQRHIAKEKNIIFNEFRGLLNSQDTYIDENICEEFKSRFNKSYCNYFDLLNMRRYIDKFNEQFIEKEKNVIFSEFMSLLDSQDVYIDENIYEEFKSRFNKSYCNYFDLFKMDDYIDEFNDKFIEKEKIDCINNFKNGYISNSEKLELIRSLNIKWDIDSIVDEHNEKYIDEQIKLERFYFDNIAGRSLDEDQIRAVLTDDDNTQIVAGAGTGKTLTLQAKVKYLIEKQGISPSDILCISFSNSARDDLAKKLEKTLGNNQVDVRTFHSIGFKILGENGEGREVPDRELINLIDDYFKENIVENPKLLKDFIEFFCYYMNIIYINDSNFKFQTIRSKLNELDQFDEYLKEYLQVEHVKQKKEYMENIQELTVANYLFIHNINFEYFVNFRYDDKNYDKFISKYNSFLFDSECEFIPNDIKFELINEIDNDFGYHDSEYYTNFYLPDYNIYINLSSSIKPNWEIESSEETKEKIRKQLDYRNKFNKSHKTKLVSILYYDDVDELLESIEYNLAENGVKINEIDYEKLFNLLIIEDNLPEYKSFIKTVERFINLFKGNAEYLDYDGNDISKFKFKQYIDENHKKYNGSIEKRNKFYLEIIAEIYEIYSNEIKGKYIDFNDMINDAVIALRKGAHIREYKYIIVDEYQDTSYTRYSLLKEMQNRTGAKVVVVGDDWQSIYGFTGCDVSLFSDFDKYFENPKMVKIQITHRNSQDLIDVVGEFIQKNKKQIPKKLKSDDKLTKKPIKLVGCMSKSEKVLSLINILDEISLKNSSAKILILGRNNRDIYEISCREIFKLYEENDYTKIVYEENPDLDIEFRTVHKSKGLEADYVVVVNLSDSIIGFPNKIANDPILDFVNRETSEGIDYPEERRLFYVALTRTVKDVFLLHNETKPSQFIDEIKNNNKVQSLKFIFSNEELLRISLLLDKPFDVLETDNICPKCNKGNVNLIVNNENGTSYFKCSNFCGWDGGPYHNSVYGEESRKLSYVKYAKVCDQCGGMLIVKSQRENPNRKFLGCNFYQTKGCRNTENIFLDLNKTDEDIYQLNKTSNDVYYLHDYIAQEKWEVYSPNKVEISKIILNYKDSIDENIVNIFTKEIMENINLISNKEIDDEIDKIALIAVPSSKVSKKNKSTMRKTINIIEEWHDKGIAQTNFGFKKEIINYKDLLERIKDVPTAHLGEGRANCEQHVESIKCNQDNLVKEKVAFIILDDITTTGATMKACKQILINEGIDEENIYSLAIGATVRGRYGEI